MNYSVNQARHLFVVKGITEDETFNPGDFYYGGAEGNFWFTFGTPNGPIRSDIINIDNVINVTMKEAEFTPLKCKKITLFSGINNGEPVPGQDYILRIQFKNYIGLSEDDQYFKYGMVHAVTGMTASDFYKELALSLVKNFSKSEEDLLSFYLEEEGEDATSWDVEDCTLVSKKTKESELTGTYTGIVIVEKPQDWKLGVMEQLPVNFSVFPTNITYNGDERLWGISNDVNTPDRDEYPDFWIGNGKKIADLEYFCMGERGDYYRNVGYPNVIRTQYLVDPTKNYATFNIHYAFIDEGMSVQKSERDLTIVVDDSITKGSSSLWEEVASLIGNLM